MEVQLALQGARGRVTLLSHPDRAFQENYFWLHFWGCAQRELSAGWSDDQGLWPQTDWDLHNYVAWGKLLNFSGPVSTSMKSREWGKKSTCLAIY